mmetsp:Transcript_74274/g.194809  ORF Transcript_74274/g.194809 Transcript_74274/m.194809 type:complete len:219 (+) Transcript_74274:30-686(+)
MGATCCGTQDSRVPPFREAYTQPCCIGGRWGDGPQGLDCLGFPRASTSAPVASWLRGPPSKDPERARPARLEETLAELFRLHDLNSNGLLEEDELILLNEKVAILHHGPGADLEAVRAKYRTLFREQFDPQGTPVAYPIFRKYLLLVLDCIDTDPRAQEMIVEQFAAEASLTRAVFFDNEGGPTNAISKFLHRSIVSWPLGCGRGACSLDPGACIMGC